uniref:Uncharacterized protein n=1 Tax=Glossina brevipalpis TaxID=37001 RepID=A0A1A9X2X1_9MUSC
MVSLLMCGVSFKVPTKTKNRPNNMERDFKTIVFEAGILLQYMAFTYTLYVCLSAKSQAPILKWLSIIIRALGKNVKKSEICLLPSVYRMKETIQLFESDLNITLRWFPFSYSVYLHPSDAVYWQPLAFDTSVIRYYRTDPIDFVPIIKNNL